MSAEEIVRAVLWAGQAYLGLGALFALAFVLVLAPRLDPAARGSSLGFRLVIFPSVALLWPLLASRWLRGRSRPTECNAHRRRARRSGPVPGPSVEGAEQ